MLSISDLTPTRGKTDINKRSLFLLRPFLNKFGYNMLEFLSRKKCLNLSMIISSYSFRFDFFSGLSRKSMFGTTGGVSSKESSSNISLLNLSLRESE